LNVKPMLSTTDTVKLLRQRYPPALICTVCACLLGTKPESYARSGLTEAARLAYVCAECRLEAADRARVADVRAENARRNFALARAAKRQRRLTQGPIENAPENVQGLEDLQDRLMSPEHGAVRRTSRTGVPIRIDRARNRGGRPRVHADHRAASRASSRAFRARRRTVAA